MKLWKAVINHGLAVSKSEIRRYTALGGILVNGATEADVDRDMENGDHVSIGNKRQFIVTLKNEDRP
jgi:tyrosyl-tRNA synthetase